MRIAVPARFTITEGSNHSIRVSDLRPVEGLRMPVKGMSVSFLYPLKEGFFLIYYVKIII